MAHTRGTAAAAAALALLAALVAAVPTAAHGTPHDRHPATHTPASTYGDPCEEAAPVDLHEVRVEDLFEDDRETVRTGTVEVEARFCAPVTTTPGLTVRVDLHPRLDTAQSDDYAETASRTLVLTSGREAWSWRLRTREGATVSSGAATTTGVPTAVTGVSAEVPACQLAAASGRRCSPDRRLPGRAPGPLPPLALRACTADVDCGPAYRTVAGRTSPDPAVTHTDVDYLPEPPYLQLTYPSICQVGGVARTAAATPSGEFLATAPAAARLVGAGFPELGRLPDGRVRMQGSVAAARALVDDDAVEELGMRRRHDTPNDPWYGPTGAGAPTGQWALARVGLQTARGLGTGESRRVAVIDTGFDGRHPELRGRAIAVRDFVATRSGDTGGFLDRNADTDLGGHGTFVSSVIAAATDNRTGMAALAPDARLLVARVFNAEGCASDGAVVEAMAWASDAGADAVNLSLGGAGTSTALENAGTDALERGVVAVAAAGNSGGTMLEYPAGYPSYLSVAATGYIDPASPEEDPVAAYSTRNAGVDLAAPGGSNRPTRPEQDVLGACWVSAEVGRGYCRESGTSFAAPLVTAAVALVRSIDPDRTAVGVERLLEDTARDIRSAPDTGPGRDDRTGAGRLDVGRALTALAGRADTLDKLAGADDATLASVAASRTAFPGGHARHVVLGRDDVFADSLAGAPLAGDDGPVLLTSPERMEPAVERELRRVMPDGGRVWVLGGDSALSPAVVERLRVLGYSPLRLHGRSRIETAVAIAREVGRHRSGQVLVASAADWPDAVAGGVYAADRGIPLLLSWPDSAAEERSPGVLAAATELGGRDVVLLGGAAALSETVAGELRSAGPVRRVAGRSRFATAAEVSRELWARRRAEAGHGFLLLNGDRADGWAMGLASAPLGARRDLPLLLVNDRMAATEPERYLRRTLRYRLDRPAHGLFVGPFSRDGDAGVRVFTAQRVRELLGG